MTVASKIIERLGGVNAVAEIVGIHRTRVSKWQSPKDRGGTGGHVPQRHIDKLMAAARERGVALSIEDFFPDHAESGSSEGAAQ